MEFVPQTKNPSLIDIPEIATVVDILYVLVCMTMDKRGRDFFFVKRGIWKN
jgi:hypothetical protein